MAQRCCCSGGGGQGITCDQVPGCVEVVAKQGGTPGDGAVTVNGTGSKTDPYVIGTDCPALRGCINITDGGDPYVHLTGTGSKTDPWTVSSDLKITTAEGSPIGLKGAGTRQDPFVIGLDCETAAACILPSALQAASPVTVAGTGGPGDPVVIGLDCDAARDCIGPTPIVADGPITVSGGGSPQSPFVVGLDCNQAAECLPPLNGYLESVAVYSPTRWQLSGTFGILVCDGVTWDDIGASDGIGLIIPADTRALVTARVEAPHGLLSTALALRLAWTPQGGGVGGFHGQGTGYAPGLISTGRVSAEITRLIGTGSVAQVLRVHAAATGAPVTDRVILQATIIRSNVSSLPTSDIGTGGPQNPAPA